MEKVTIIGAGIAGLTAAIALKQRGFEVEVFENAPEFKPVGAGINLAMNAMQIYRKLGVYNDIINQASHLSSMNLRTKNLGYLSTFNLQHFEAEYGVKSVAIHRAVLHEILLDHLGDTPIYLKKNLRSLSQVKGKVMLQFEDGSEHNSEILVGADGIHSVVRQCIMSNTHLRDARQICWRGISSAQIDPMHFGELNEIWGKGNRFGFVHINHNEIYWYALINKNQLTTKDQDLALIFADYHPTVLQILRETPKTGIICSEIWDLDPIDHWYRNRVCLLGDAAHATTPNLGQGACQAIESALALSISLSEENSVNAAFARYESVRKSKANQIVNTSWRIGKMAQINNHIAVHLRNLLLKLTPNFVMEQQNRSVFSLNF